MRSREIEANRPPKKAFGAGIMTKHQRTSGRWNHLRGLRLDEESSRITFHRDMNNHVWDQRSRNPGRTRTRVKGCRSRRSRFESFARRTATRRFPELSRITGLAVRVVILRRLTRIRRNTVTELRILEITVLIRGHVTILATSEQFLDVIRHSETMDR